MQHSRSTRRSCSVPFIFVHLTAPMFSIPGKVGHATVTRRAHHPFANRTHAIVQTFSLPKVLQTSLGTAASHVSNSKAANARHASRPDQCRHVCRSSVATMPASTEGEQCERRPLFGPENGPIFGTTFLLNIYWNFSFQIQKILEFKLKRCRGKLITNRKQIIDPSIFGADLEKHIGSTFVPHTHTHTH
jgi:hypothetical protein